MLAPLLVNLTPFTITIAGCGGDVVIPPSGKIAIVRSYHGERQPIRRDDLIIPVWAVAHRRVAGVPDTAKEGVYYLVTPDVQRELNYRPDMLSWIDAVDLGADRIRITELLSS